MSLGLEVLRGGRQTWVYVLALPPTGTMALDKSSVLTSKFYSLDCRWWCKIFTGVMIMSYQTEIFIAQHSGNGS